MSRNGSRLAPAQRIQAREKPESNETNQNKKVRMRKLEQMFHQRMNDAIK